jgi:hypothetical protein
LVVDEYPILVKTMLVLGTAWRWARWSDKLRRLVREAIPDNAIMQIVIDLDTQEILELYTDEYIEYYQQYQAVEWAQWRRHITREKVTVTTMTAATTAGSPRAGIIQNLYLRTDNFTRTSGH